MHTGTACQVPSGLQASGKLAAPPAMVCHSCSWGLFSWLPQRQLGMLFHRGVLPILSEGPVLYNTMPHPPELVPGLPVQTGRA